MAADFNINLARSMASSGGDRVRFYNRMLIYLVVCAVGMVYIAFFSSLNVVKTVKANRHRQMLVGAVTSVSDYSKIFYADPSVSYQVLANYARDLETLRVEVAQRAQFLPVLNELFKDFPSTIMLQELGATASDKTIRFELVAPVFDKQGNDPVRQLQTVWKGNDDLQRQVNGIRQVTSERRVVGNTAVAFVKFECIAK